MKKLIGVLFVAWNLGVFAQEYTSFQASNDKWGFLDLSGNVVIEPIFDRAGDFSQGRAAVLFGGTIGYIDTSGKIVIPCKYDWSSGFLNGFATVKLAGKYGFIDLDGNEIVPIKYDFVFSFVNGFAIVNQGGTLTEKGFLGGKFGVIDTLGKEVISPKYDYIHSYKMVYFQQKNQLLAEVVRASKVLIEDGNLILMNHQVGLINADGKEVLPLKYGEINFTNDGQVWAMKEGRWGMLDQFGKKMTPFKYDESPYAQTEIEGPDSVVLIRVEANSKYGFINLKGEEVIETIYENLFDFSQNLIAMQLEGKWGFLDFKGKVVVPFIYDKVQPFSDGISQVELSGESFTIDLTGKRIK